MMHRFYEYNPEYAAIYSALGIENTTYEIGFKEMQELLGDIRGKAFLDVGCGAGRSSIFLKMLGAKKVHGVDHDNNMIAIAKTIIDPQLEFIIIDGVIPLSDQSMDGAIS